MRILEIKPVEPLSLSLMPIGGMEIFTVIRSTPIPLPTTVAGALGVSMGVAPSLQDPLESLIELSRRLTELCRGGKPVVQGPLTCFDDVDIDTRKCYVYVYPEKLLSLSFIESVNIGSKPTYLDLRDCGRDYSNCIEFTPLTLVGTSLERRSPGEDKVVKLGYMYKYPLIAYAMSKKEETVRQTYIYKLNCRRDLDGVVRFGGEGRIARLTVKEVGVAFLENIVNPLNGLKKGLYLALSPIPVMPLKDTSPLLLNEDSVALPIPIRSVIGVPQSSRPPKIRVERLGLGFSEVAGKRRAEIFMLPPGTMILIEEEEVTKSFGECELMKELLNIGFASLYKVR